MQKQKIVSRWDESTVLYECEVPDGLESGMALRHALEHAVVARANLSGADLIYADLSYAHLSYARLSDADLRGADLRGANLRGAYLIGAYLRDANLSGADLRGANLSGANLSYAKDAELAIAKTRILGDGSLIGWKKCRNSVIVKLRIPEDAKRSHAFCRKCRAEFADVLEVFGGRAISLYDGVTEYKAGERVKPDSFSDNWRDECAPGIHFYLTRIEAENH